MAVTSHSKSISDQNSSLGKPGNNNWPHVNIAHSVIRAFLNNQGAAHVNEQHRQALETALPALMNSSAWAKIIELWVPLGADLAGALVKLKYPAGNSAALTNHNFVNADYTPTGGLTGDGTSKYLTSDANPSSLGLTANNFGLAVHTPALPVNAASLSANSVAVSCVQGAHYFYALGQLFNQFVFDADILQPTQQPFLNYNNGSGGITPPWGMARMSWVQSFGGKTACGCAALTMTSKPSTSGNVVPNATIELYGIGSGSLFNGTLTGYALFQGMTDSELDILSRFFDQINHLAYRSVLDGLLAFGDSIIRGNTLPSYTTQRWTYLLAQALGLNLANFGMDGSTMSVCPLLGNTGTPNIYNCFEYDPTSDGSSPTQNKKGYLGLVLQNSGALVVLGLGMNDLSYSGNMANFITSYTQTLTQLQKAGFSMANVLIAGITYSPASGGSLPSNGYYTPALAQIWNGALSNLAAEFGCIYVDMYSLWNSSNWATYLNSDQIHPNSAGHIAMFKQALATYQAAPVNVVSSYVTVN